jgi:hypothetical protein
MPLCGPAGHVGLAGYVGQGWTHTFSEAFRSWIRSWLLLLSPRRFSKDAFNKLSVYVKNTSKFQNTHAFHVRRSTSIREREPD